MPAMYVRLIRRDWQCFYLSLWGRFSCIIWFRFIKIYEKSTVLLCEAGAS